MNNINEHSSMSEKQNKQPGKESSMHSKPIAQTPYPGIGKLKHKVAIITGGDSGIGKAVALSYAKEGADIVIVYLDEHEDAKETQQKIFNLGRECLLFAGDVADHDFCHDVIKKTYDEFGKIDILVNNAAVQFPQEEPENITPEQIEKTFRTNIFSYFYMTLAALPYLKEGSCIINTTSVTAYKGSAHLIDYSATKGAIVSFTRSLASALVKRGIRVNGVAPGPVWTPLITASFSEDQITHFGEQVPMERPAQPAEIAPTYVFLASQEGSYYSGQILHPNGGVVVNG